MKKKWQRALAIIAVLVAVRVGLRALPHAPLIQRTAQGVVVRDRDGGVLAFGVASDGQLRHWVPLVEIAPALVDATLLYEDRWFRWHFGVNPVALVRGAYQSATSSRLIGASTLSMQVVRRLDRLSTRTIGGKLHQIVAAVWLDLRYSKDEILEAYLNLAPYGGNVEGAFAASLAYFGEAPNALSLEQALTLAVIPQNPHRRGKLGVNADLAAARADLWARWKRQHAATSIDGRAIAELAMNDIPPLLRRALPSRAPHFARRLVNETRAMHDVTHVDVVSTLDPAVQALAESHLQSYLQLHSARGVKNASLIVVDARSAEVRALIGSANFGSKALRGEVDGTRARRSPGSTLKPFIYALAIEQGLITPSSLVRDLPIRYADYTPENFDGKFAGPITATEALIRSRNIPAIELAQRLHSPTLYDLLQRSKIGHLHSAAYYGAGIALGSAEVTLEELVGMYTALGNGGELRPLERRLHVQPVASSRIMSPEASFLVLNMLEHNPRPDRLANVNVPTTPIAWKTGTSWGFRDAWTVGVVGPYVIGVWTGDFRGHGDPAYTGLTAAAPLFLELADALVTELGTVVTLRVAPSTLEHTMVCALSGDLPSDHCPHQTPAWFWPGHSPIMPCARHRVIAVDAHGHRACAASQGATHPEVVEVWSSDERTLFASAGLQRKSLPEPAPECTGFDEIGAKPRITSPTKNVVYSLADDPHDPIALGAVVSGDASEVFWYANQRLLGRAHAGESLLIDLPAGHYTLLAVDNHGRSDTRALTVTANP